MNKEHYTMVYVLRYGFDYIDPSELYLCKRKKLSNAYDIREIKENEIIPS